jgi:RNA polymerase sigma factor (sigma-70 family)
MATFPFEDIYQQYSALVYNLCLQHLSNAQDAEEATQDIFVKIHTKLTSFEGKSSLKTWIYRISINHCLDLLRARKRQKRLAFIIGLFTGSEEQPMELPHFNHPGILLEQREGLEQLLGTIHTLPDQQKTALLLRYMDALSPPDIADIMGLSLKAVESLLQRAKSNLEKKLRKHEGI